jgi:hypothetical protein
LFPRLFLVLVLVGSLAASAAGAAVNPKEIPLGDGHISTSPRAGYVDSCQTSFGGAGGAQAIGPWINTAARTWDSTAKIHVAGNVSWDGTWLVKTTGTTRTVATNDLPSTHGTGTFPVGATDPAASYDRNPNSIAAQSVTFRLPLNPKPAAKPACLSLGSIGILTDGVVLYDALDGEGRDAAAHEVLDFCGGHPDMSSTYHHHEVPSCILDKAKSASTLVGYARDGYGIYVERDARGALLSNANLDVCHGRTSVVSWNGKTQSVYHYVATIEYPYTLGCYHGTPASGR